LPRDKVRRDQENYNEWEIEEKEAAIILILHQNLPEQFSKG